MPHWCIAYGCQNSSKNNNGVSFHRLPLKDEALLKIWIAKIRRTNSPVNEHARLCSDHFEDTCFVRKGLVSSTRKLKDGSYPTKFVFKKEIHKRKEPKDRRDQQAIDSETCKATKTQLPDCTSSKESTEQTMDVTSEPTDKEPIVNSTGNGKSLKRRVDELEIELQESLLKNQMLSNTVTSLKFSCDNLSKKDEIFKFYTGFSQLQFDVVYEFLGPAVNNLVYWGSSRNETTESAKRGPARQLTPKDEFLLVLCRLRVGLLVQDLAWRFGISPSHVSRIFISWVNFLYQRFKELDTWPTRKQCDANMPGHVKKEYPKLRCIIDATEIFVEQPKNPEAQQLTWSSYKNHNTLKALIGITPSGAISFVSALFGGSISDRELTIQSGILQKKWDRYDMVMADRGFDVQDLFVGLGVVVNIPPFLNGKSQLEESELLKTRRIASLRIHVERAMERIKNFRILDCTTSKMMENGVIDQVFFTCCMLSNFHDPLIE